MVACNRQARSDLKTGLIRYMAGEIRTFAFDDQNWAAGKSADRSVHQVSRFLWHIHDDCIDHPISVSPQTWDRLRRIVGFLGTDLNIETTITHPSWPFRDEDEWHSNEQIVNGLGLPEYNPSKHCSDRSTRHWEVNPWCNRIPSSIGFAIFAGIVGAVVVMLFWI